MASAVDIDTFVDGLKFGKVHLRIVVICFLMMMIDGFDLQVLGWVLPKIAEDYGVPRTDFTVALMSQQVGMVLGAYLISPLGDRIGRRGLLLLCASGVAVSSFATIFAESVLTLAACRLVTGAFASAMIGNLVSLAAEAAPKRIRGTLTGIVLAGAMPGALLGSAMQAFLLERAGWQGAFWIATAMPALMLPVVYFLLPESLRFLATKRPGDPKIAVMMRSMQEKGAAEVTLLPVPQPPPGKAWFASNPFTHGGMALTLLLWAAFICSFSYISAGVWKTTVFREDIGLDWQMVATTTALNTGAGLIGMLTIGFCIDKLGFKAVVPTFFVLAAGGAVLTGLGAPGALMFVGIVMMGAFQHGAHAGLASLASTLYPTSHRAAGIGWAYGAGRIASVMGPLLGASAMTRLDAMTFFIVLGAPLFLAGVVVLILLSRRSNAELMSARPAGAGAH